MQRYAVHREHVLIIHLALVPTTRKRIRGPELDIVSVLPRAPPDHQHQHQHHYDDCNNDNGNGNAATTTTSVKRKTQTKTSAMAIGVTNLRTVIVREQPKNAARTT